jgi:hypothetical protein
VLFALNTEVVVINCHPLARNDVDIYSPIRHYNPISLIEGRCLEASGERSGMRFRRKGLRRPRSPAVLAPAGRQRPVRGSDRKTPLVERRKARRRASGVLRCGCPRSPRGCPRRNDTVRHPALRLPRPCAGGRRVRKRTLLVAAPGRLTKARARRSCVLSAPPSPENFQQLTNATRSRMTLPNAAHSRASKTTENSALDPSFETPAARAPQDEACIHGRILGPHAEEAPKGAVSKHGPTAPLRRA